MLFDNFLVFFPLLSHKTELSNLIQRSTRNRIEEKEYRNYFGKFFLQCEDFLYISLIDRISIIEKKDNVSQ